MNMGWNAVWLRIALVIAGTGCAPASPVEIAAVAGPASASDQLNFVLAGEVLATGSVQLSNGTPVQSQDWLSLVFAVTQSSTVPVYCTASLVGPNVLLTAAHCLDRGSAVLRPAALVIQGEPFSMACSVPQAYLAARYRPPSPRSNADFALCRISFGPTPPVEIRRLKFDVVDEDALRLGQPVLLSGYGCTNFRAENGRLVSTPSERVLNVGDGAVTAAAGGFVSYRADAASAPALCPGDSGGPLITGASSTDTGRPRRIRALNSSISMVRRPDGGFDITSNFATLNSPAFKSFAGEWLQTPANSGARICGLNAAPGAYPCRD